MEKINIAKLLKDCPKGMELDCTVFENLTFEEIDEVNSRILCNIQGNNGKIGISFNKFGCYSELNQAKCVIFPKGKTTWEGFVPPCKFKNGDIIYNQNIKATAIFYKQTDEYTISHCFLNIFEKLRRFHYHSKFLYDWRLATEEEKEILLKAIKDNGYYWNAETKTLDKLAKPYFKVGDRIRHKITKKTCIITYKNNLSYYLDNSNFAIWIEDQDEWELVPNKFDITTLKPFESRVLVRNIGAWEPAFWGYYSKEYAHPFVVAGGNTFAQCIPYEGNEHLRGKTTDCDDFYKTWEK